MRCSPLAVLLSIIAVLAASSAGRAADLSIKRGDQVIRVDVTTVDQLKNLESMDLDIWSHEYGVGPIDVHVSTEELTQIERAGFTYKTLNPDLFRTRQEEIQAYQDHVQRAARGVATPFDSYLPLADIITFLNNLVAARPDLCEMMDIGNTVEGRDIWAIHITGAGAGPKPGVFYHGLIHAREWIAGPVVMYLADYLVNNYDTDPCVKSLVDSTDFYLSPCVNPDGYNYTWTTYRLWRKNRRNNGGSFGVDLNRNFAYQWGEHGDGGSSGSASSDTYRGLSPASEPETQAIQAFVTSHLNIKAYMDYHSYSQLLMWPWGYTSTLTPDNAKFSAIGNKMQQLIQDVHATYYQPGPVYTTIYPANGVSIDYVYGTAGRFPFTIELRDTGTFGFELPADQILPTCEENLPGILYLSRWASSGILLDVQTVPQQVIVGQTTPISVTLNSAQENYVAGSGLLHFRFSPAVPYSTTPLVLQSGTTYVGTLPAAPCVQTAEFYLTASGNGGSTAAAPCSAPMVVYSAPIVLAAPTLERAYSFPMTTNPGWTLSTGWAYGTPTGSCGDPNSGYTGSSVVGYNLSGCYANNIPVRYATTSAINCSNLVHTQLRFRRWLGLETSQYDHASIQASNNGTTWTTIWDYIGPTLSETSWSLQTYDISAIADEQATVYIRWGMGPSDGGVVGCGWNIDDVEIWAAQACPTIIVNPASLANATVGSMYAQPLAATGGTGAYTFAVACGSLPAGLTLSPSGLLSGTPSGPVGAVDFAVTATDSNSCTGNQFLSVTVMCPAITVSPTTMPSTFVNRAYTKSVTASGGTGPYTYAVTAGSLPPGLSLSAAGVLSGTTTSGGTYNFTVTATDAYGCTSSHVYSIAVRVKAVDPI